MYCRYMSRDHRESDKYSRENQIRHQSPLHHEREHQLQQQMRENQMQRERERHQDFRDLHYREQQLHIKMREHERMRDQPKHRELLPPGQIPSIRDNHIQQQHPHQTQTQPREIETHQYQRNSSASGTGRLTVDSHLRTPPIPTSLYSAHRTVVSMDQPSFDNSRILQSSVSTSTINFHRDSQASSSKPEMG